MHFPRTIFSLGKGEWGWVEGGPGVAANLGRPRPRTAEMGEGQGEAEVAHLLLPQAGERKKERKVHARVTCRK